MVFIYFIILLALLLLKPDVVGGMDRDLLQLYSVIFVLALLVHFISISRTSKNWVRADIFFLLGFTIVHFQWPIAYSIFRFFPDYLNEVWLHKEVVNYAVWLSAIGGVAWVMGYHAFYNWGRVVQIRNICITNHKYLRFVILLFFGFFFLFVGRDFLGGVYRGTKNWGAGATYAYLLFTLFLNIYLISAFAKKSDTPILAFIKENYFVFGITLVYVLFFLSIGDRGGPLTVLILLLVLFSEFVSSISLKKFVILAFVGAFVMAVIGAGRNRGGDIVSTGIENVGSNAPTEELANSFRTLSLAVYEVEQHGFFYGQLMIGNVLSAIPFSQSLYVKLFDVPTYLLGSAKYGTHAFHGDNEKSGIGTTIIADIYYNFGSIGVLVLMFLLGGLYGKAYRNAFMKQKPNWTLLYFILASLALYQTRAAFLDPLNIIVWSIFVVFMTKNRKYKNA